MNPTDYVAAGTVVLLLGWEGWTLVNKRPADTLSETAWRAISARPIVPFLLGLLMGHWVWQARP